MKAIYLDIFSGISGDMFIGAMLDLGVDFQKFEEELAKLKLHDVHVHVSKQIRGRIAGTKFDVHLGHHGNDSLSPTSHSEHSEHGHEHPGHSHSHGPHQHQHTHEHHAAHAHRTLVDIQKLISEATLSPWVKTKAVAVFKRVAQAEGKIHGQPPEKVHFHEVGAIDSIIDIVGACVALEMLGKPRVFAGPVIEGKGVIHCAHGCFPLPAPATLEILTARGIPIQQCDEPNELVTPTGAALLAEFAESFAPIPSIVPDKIGYGLGSRENQTRPNVLRAILGEVHATTAFDWDRDTVGVLETNIDDLNPEILGAFVEKALTAGALDVYYTPIQMKKSRPGVMLTVLCPVTEADRFSRLMLEETSAFGVRCTTAERRKLQREFIKVHTPYGEATVKVGRLNGKILQMAPEFETCKALAEQAQVPVKQVYEAVLKAAPVA